MVVSALDDLLAAGPAGRKAASILELLDRGRPLPPAIVVLRALVDAGWVHASPDPVTVGSVLVLTERGRAELDAALERRARSRRPVDPPA